MVLVVLSLPNLEVLSLPNQLTCHWSVRTIKSSRPSAKFTPPMENHTDVSEFTASPKQNNGHPVGHEVLPAVVS